MTLTHLLMVSGLLGCQGGADSDSRGDGGVDSGPGEAPTETPWLSWEAEAVGGLLPLLEVALPAAEAPAQVETIPSRSLTVVWDPGAEQAWVLDARYRHSPAPVCVPSSEWPDWTGPQRSCGEGEVFTQRGALGLPGGIADIAVAPDEREILVLGAAGTLWRVEADPLVGNPLDHLRPVDTRIAPLEGASRIAPAGDGEALVAVGAELLRVDLATGEAASEATLPDPPLDLFVLGGVSWARTEGGLYRDGVLVEGSAEPGDAVPLAGGEGILLTAPGAGEIRHVSADAGAVAESRHAVAGLTGPLAISGDGAHLYALTEAGLVVIEDASGAEVGAAEGAFVDVAAGPAAEVVALAEDGVAVFGDEELLSIPGGGAEPVALMIAAFVEQPRSSSTSSQCRGDDSLYERAERAGDNARALAELPAAVALGLTPHFARRAEECDALEPLAPLLALERSAVGALFHELHDCDEADTACIAAFLGAEADEIEDLGATVRFSSGLAPQSGDWIAALEQAGLPERYMFFGASVLSDISAEGDPRAKDAWPLTERASLWRAASVEDVGERGDSGWLVMQPGDNLPAFNLGACPNLFLRECHLSGVGGGSQLKASDVAVLTLLARRAVAEQRGPSAWSFHLPDLGVYDYTDDCFRSEEGIWSGEGCAAGLLQEWSRVMHSRYVLNGYARWATPDAVAAP